MIFYAITLIGGALMAAQAAINGRLTTGFPHPTWAALISFGVGTTGLGAVVAYYSMRDGMPRTEAIAALPGWAWIGGLFGAFYVTIASIVIPRIGSSALTAFTVLGMAIAALVIDSTGAFGVTTRGPTVIRIIGVVCVGLGAVLVSRQ